MTITEEAELGWEGLEKGGASIYHDGNPEMTEVVVVNCDQEMEWDWD